MSEETKDADRIRRRIPDYFKALEMPWHLAASFMAAFVNDDEESLGVPGAHARNLFHVAKAIQEETAHLRHLLAAAEKERDQAKSKEEIAMSLAERYEADIALVKKEWPIIHEGIKRYHEMKAKLSLYESAPSEPESEESLKCADASVNWKLANLKRCADALIPLARVYRACQAKLADEETRHLANLQALSDAIAFREKAESELAVARKEAEVMRGRCVKPGEESQVNKLLIELDAARAKIEEARSGLEADALTIAASSRLLCEWNDGIKKPNERTLIRLTMNDRALDDIRAVLARLGPKEAA
jgi:hypothetical protein